MVSYYRSWYKTVGVFVALFMLGYWVGRFLLPVPATVPVPEAAVEHDNGSADYTKLAEISPASWRNTVVSKMNDQGCEVYVATAPTYGEGR